MVLKSKTTVIPLNSRSLPLLLIAILIVLLIPFSTSFSQELKPIYDGRLSPKPTMVPESIYKLMNEKILPAARQNWHEEEEDQDCMTGSGGVALDMAEGAFTKPNSDQKAILYRFCETGPGTALNGIAIIENDQVISHLAFAGNTDTAIGALPDINRNGRSEILLASSGMHMGETWKSISIIELSDTIVLTKFGRINAYRDNCSGVIKKGKGRAEAQIILVKAGKSPAFYQKSYINKDACDESGKWMKSGDLKELSLENDEASFQYIK